MSLAFLAIAAALTTAPTDDLSSWSRYSDPSGTFSMQLPGGPTVVKDGNSTTHRVSSSSGDYWVTSSPVSPGLESLSPGDVLAVYRDRFLRLNDRKENGLLLLSTPGYFEGRPSLTFAQIKGPRRAKNRIDVTLIYLGDRVLTVAYAANGAVYEKTRMAALLGTLELGAVPPPPPLPPVREWPSAPCGPEERFTAGKDATQPRLLESSNPEYPEPARHHRLQGAVVIETVITEDGHVTEPRVLVSVAPLLDDAALEAVSKWRYEPAMKDGKPVCVHLTLTSRFTLDRPQHSGN